MSASRQRRNERRDRRTHVCALARPRLPAMLLDVLDHAKSVWEDFCFIFHTPAELAERACISRADHAEMRDWIYHLELLMRRFIFAAASMLNIVLRPIAARIAHSRTRRRIIIWPSKPRLWPARFSMPASSQRRATLRNANPKPQPRVLPTLPLARRLEALRRILVDPTPRIRRHAIRLARLAAQNTRANAPRRMRIRYWDLGQAHADPGPTPHNDAHARRASARLQRRRCVERSRRTRLVAPRKKKPRPAGITCGNAAPCLQLR